jgi:uncharacterized Zn-finger protein
VCEVCQKIFKNKNSLKTHSATHKTIGDLECPHCAKRYKYKTGLIYHIRRDHTGKWFCSVFSSSLLDFHAFTGEKPYRCPIDGCSYRAIDYPNAKKHIRLVHKSNDHRPVKVEENKK